MNIDTFLKLEHKEIARIVEERGKLCCVAIMLDGTRRVLKLKPRYHDDSWLYYEDHIRNLIYKSMEVTDLLFNMGIKVVVGPLASFGNLHRRNFMPKGLKRLLDPLLEDYPSSVFKRHNVSISFYGDLGYAKSMPGGNIISDYQKHFKRMVPKHLDRHVLIGLGFSTDRETKLIAHKAIDYYKKNGRKPSRKELVIDYFGSNIPPIDIFIRSNEVRTSGGLTPLLTAHDTQLYFPVSPGVISFSEEVIRRIFYDYLFSRSLSHGMHEHSPVTTKEAIIIKKFYFGSKDEVLGIGRRVGDVWIHQPEKISAS